MAEISKCITTNIPDRQLRLINLLFSNELYKAIKAPTDCKDKHTLDKYVNKFVQCVICDSKLPDYRAIVCLKCEIDIATRCKLHVLVRSLKICGSRVKGILIKEPGRYTWEPKGGDKDIEEKRKQQTEFLDIRIKEYKKSGKDLATAIRQHIKQVNMARFSICGDNFPDIPKFCSLNDISIINMVSNIDSHNELDIILRANSPIGRLTLGELFANQIVGNIDPDMKLTNYSFYKGIIDCIDPVTFLPIACDPIMKQCELCKKHDSEKICSACKIIRYCTVECQRKDWKNHKLYCKKIQDGLDHSKR